MSRARILVGDHALVRWLERTGALDVEGLRTMLASSLERGRAAADRLDAARYSIVADGLIYIVRDGRLVTVYVDEGLGARIKASS